MISLLSSNVELRSRGGFVVFLRDCCLRLGCAEVGGGLRQQSSSSIT